MNYSKFNKVFRPAFADLSCHDFLNVVLDKVSGSIGKSHNDVRGDGSAATIAVGTVRIDAIGFVVAVVVFVAITCVLKMRHLFNNSFRGIDKIRLTARTSLNNVPQCIALSRGVFLFSPSRGDPSHCHVHCQNCFHFVAASDLRCEEEELQACVFAALRQIRSCNRWTRPKAIIWRL